MKTQNRHYLFSVVLTAVLIAVEVVLERMLAINAWNLKYSFAFVPIAAAAVILGAPWAMAVAAVGDIIGALLFPLGAYFPGFTFTALLTAFCTAFFIHKNATFLKIAISVLINQFLGGLVLNSFWISILYNKGFIALIPARFLQAVAMSVVQIVVTYALFGEKSAVRKNLSRAVAKVN